MDVWIARGGLEIGSFRREDLETLARSGQLKPSDHYWHDGMEEWDRLGRLIGREPWKRQLPQDQTDRIDRWFVLGAVLGAILIAAAYFLISRIIVD